MDAPMLNAWQPPVPRPERERRRSYLPYANTSRLDHLRAAEYGYLDEHGQTYLDYTGAALPSGWQLREHVRRIQSGCFGNPHSDNPTSRASTELVDQTRQAVLSFFHASPAEYAVIFTANASGACRLVGEGYDFGDSGRLVLTFDNHNSVNGIREFATARGAEIDYIPLTPGDLRVDEQVVRDHLTGSARRRGTVGASRTAMPRGLFAFPAQSNFTGVHHPLELVDVAHQHGYDVLLDAAAFVPTNRLDLSRVHADFVPVSWYKVFGYPTGVGCLVARREALARLRRPWFSGGTIQAVSVQGLWHLLALDESAFEDGTLNYLGIPDVKSGLAWLRHVDFDLVHQRASCLTDWLLQDLGALRHHNDRPAVRIYGPAHVDRRGATVAFNFVDPDGQVVDERAVSRDASANGISLRTGCFCNPGAGEAAFAILKETLTGSISHEPHTIDEYLTLLGLPSAGAIRVSFGLASNLDDLDRFVQFAERTYVDRYPDNAGLTPRLGC